MPDFSQTPPLEEILDIYDLLLEGMRRFKFAAKHMNSPLPIPGADLYFARALELFHQRGIQSPGAEFFIELKLASYLAFTERCREAIPHFERAADLKPENTKVRKYLAVTYEMA